MAHNHTTRIKSLTSIQIQYQPLRFNNSTLHHLSSPLCHRSQAHSSDSQSTTESTLAVIECLQIV